MSVELWAGAESGSANVARQGQSLNIITNLLSRLQVDRKFIGALIDSSPSVDVAWL